MGLSVTDYEFAELLPMHEIGEDCADRDHVTAFTLAGFEASGAGLELGRHYRVTGRSTERDWPYSVFNAFREALSWAALGVAPAAVWDDREKWAGHPFVLLIDFADNEGCIGPAAAAVLAGEFTEHADRVRPRLTDLEYRRDYNWWTEATRLAAGKGLITYL